MKKTAPLYGRCGGRRVPIFPAESHSPSFTQRIRKGIFQQKPDRCRRKGQRRIRYQNVVRRPIDAGKHVDVVGGEVAVVAGPLARAAAPAGGEHGLAGVGVVEEDEVALLQVQEQRRRRVP